MAKIEIAPAAIDALLELIATHSLPADTRARVGASLRTLGQFPLAGRELRGASDDLRAIIGPWRWLMIVYLYEEIDDRVTVMEFRDSRSSTFKRA